MSEFTGEVVGKSVLRSEMYNRPEHVGKHTVEVLVDDATAIPLGASVRLVITERRRKDRD